MPAQWRCAGCLAWNETRDVSCRTCGPTVECLEDDDLLPFEAEYDEHVRDMLAKGLEFMTYDAFVTLAESAVPTESLRLECFRIDADDDDIHDYEVDYFPTVECLGIDDEDSYEYMQEGVGLCDALHMDSQKYMHEDGGHFNDAQHMDSQKFSKAADALHVDSQKFSKAADTLHVDSQKFSKAADAQHMDSQKYMQEGVGLCTLHMDSQKHMREGDGLCALHMDSQKYMQDGSELGHASLHMDSQKYMQDGSGFDDTLHMDSQKRHEVVLALVSASHDGRGTPPGVGRPATPAINEGILKVRASGLVEQGSGERNTLIDGTGGGTMDVPVPASKEGILEVQTNGSDEKGSGERNVLIDDTGGAMDAPFPVINEGILEVQPNGFGIKHGRSLMAASLDFITPERSGELPGYLSSSAGNKFADVPHGLATAPLCRAA